MKKFAVVLILSVSFLLTPQNSYTDSTTGYGEVQLSERMVDYFINYIKGDSSKAPELYVMTIDGDSYAAAWFCSAGTSNCRGGSRKKDVEICQMDALKITGVRHECLVFAKQRTIVWANDINVGGKSGRINSRWSVSEIKAKLNELGFYQNN